MERKTVLIIMAMSIVTYLPRVLPVLLLSRVRMPEWFMRWLKHIPAAVLSALLVPAILMPGDTVDVRLANRNLLAAIPCFIAAFRTKNLFITVITGIISMLLLNLVFSLFYPITGFIEKFYIVIEYRL